ncbi:MAG: hypothetical protein PVJ36_04535 [Nitrospirota bacterium]|jgi:hypothetical protein
MSGGRVQGNVVRYLVGEAYGSRPHYGLIYDLLLHTPLPLAAVLRLTPRHLRPKSREIHIGKHTVKPPDGLYDALQKYIKVKKPSPYGRLFPVHRNSVYTHLERLSLREGLGRLRIKDIKAYRDIE